MVSCKTNGSETKRIEECDLFQIGNYKFYNPRVYEHPVIFEKGAHDLLNKDFTPLWYAGYCAENLPNYFNSKEAYIQHIHSAKIKKMGLAYYESFYEANKNNERGKPGIIHDKYHLLFRGTVSVKNLNSKREYLLVAGKNYIETVEDFDKNTEFYEPKVENMYVFLLEDGVYKQVDDDYVLGTFDKTQHDKVFDILNVETLVNSVCFESINTLNKTNFNSESLPRWVYNKSELIQ